MAMYKRIMPLAIVLSAFGSADTLSQAERDPGSRKPTDEAVMKFMTDRTIKAQAPAYLQPSLSANKKALVLRFTASRDRTIAYIQKTTDDLRHHYTVGALGPTDAYQTIIGMSQHCEKHIAQMRDVKSSPMFPMGSSARRMNKLAVVGCGQLLTMTGPGLGIIEDGAMLVHDGLIAKVGAQREIEPLVDASYVIVEADERLVMPGFVDAHTHPVFAGSRADEFEMRAGGATYREIAAAGGGILSTVRKTRAASEKRLIRAAKLYEEWFLRNGTTTIEAKSGYGLSLKAEVKILRVIRLLNELGPLRYVPTFLGAHEVPKEFRGRTSKYVDLVIHEMLPEIAAEQLAEYCDVFCEPGVFSVGEAHRILWAARGMGLGLRIHADQFSLSGGAELAAELHAATADHLEYTDSAGIAALKKARVQPVLLPGSVYALGSHMYPDARAMLDAGLAVVLATDFNPGTSPTPSMPMILSLACTQMRMTPAEAIRAATINAARSLGWSDEIGSLEPGKRADFVIHDLADYRELPYHFGVEPAWKVFIEGRLVLHREYAILPPTIV
jgi:imidazolonepropionase